MTTESPIRTVWRCAECGSEKVERDHLAPMGTFATGWCNEEKGRKRPLRSIPADELAALIEKNDRRRHLKTLAGQIRRGTVASHVYVPGERPEGANPRSPKPCAAPMGAKPCNWSRVNHPSEADLKELRWGA